MAIEAAIIRRIRTLIPDNEPVHGDNGDEYIFSDEELEDFYTEGYENVKCAAGLALQTIGSAMAWLLRAIKNYETETDGSKLLKEYSAAGKRLYDLGLDEVANEYSGFDVIYPEDEYRHPEGMSHGSYRLGGWY
jgi:hypothetical protein